MEADMLAVDYLILSLNSMT